MDKIRSFDPIVEKGARFLILGSIPGSVSLQKKQYYAYQQNQFWKIIYTLFQIPLEEDYEKRILFLKVHNIALWDVIQNCYRLGSLDSKIHSEEINNFDLLFQSNPSIRYILFNGSTAFNLFRRKVGFRFNNILLYKKLPSTSPARAIPFEEKLKEWLIIKELSV